MKTGVYNVGVCLLTSAESTLDRFEEPERRSAEKTSDRTNDQRPKIFKTHQKLKTDYMERYEDKLYKRYIYAEFTKLFQLQI